METLSSSELLSSDCGRHSRLSLTGSGCSALHTSRTRKAPHRTANKQTADCSCCCFTSKERRQNTVHWLLLVSLFVCQLSKVCNGLLIYDSQGSPNITRNEKPNDARMLEFSQQPWYWENATIPYVIDRNLPLRLKRQSIKAMCVWMKQTNCIKFVERTDEPHFIRFQFNFKDGACDSFVGKVRFPFFYPPGQEPVGQPVELGFLCNRGLIAHELGHAAGFYHEHERKDRDLYVEIDHRFVIPTSFAQKQFIKSNNRYMFGLDYDYGSMMHFPLDAYSKDGNHTLIHLQPYDGEIGQRKRLSASDRFGVNQLYNCSDVGANRYMLPDSPNTIKDGDWVILNPAGGLRQERLTCTRDNCSFSDCAGKLFKPQDVKKCPGNLITIRKSPNNQNNDSTIRVNDIILLQWEGYEIHRYYPSPHGGPMYGPVSTETMFCSNNQSCSLSGRCNDTQSSCSEQEFVVKVIGKEHGMKLEHEDVIVLTRTIPIDGYHYSYYYLKCTESKPCAVELLCEDGGFSACQHLALKFNLYKY